MILFAVTFVLYFIKTLSGYLTIIRRRRGEYRLIQRYSPSLRRIIVLV
jgi:mRNA-degrading endonuclease RelE of RelBE toxin-antitoxin system